MQLSGSRFACGTRLVVAISLAWAASTCALQAAENAPQPQITKASDTRSVTILGVTRGVAFLESAEPVADGGRAAGAHPVEWLQVKILVESLAGAKGLGAYKWELLTPEGQPITTPKAVGEPATSATNRASSVVESDLNSPCLAALLSPSRVPPAKAKSSGRVLLLGVSGSFRESKEMRLKLSFAAEGGHPADAFEFLIPVP